jgi:hypothetical protein
VKGKDGLADVWRMPEESRYWSEVTVAPVVLVAVYVTSQTPVCERSGAGSTSSTPRFGQLEEELSEPQDARSVAASSADAYVPRRFMA